MVYPGLPLSNHGWGVEGILTVQETAAWPGRTGGRAEPGLGLLRLAVAPPVWTGVGVGACS